MKIFYKSYAMACKKLPEIIEDKYREYHFAYIFKRNKCIASSHNDYAECMKCNRLAREFNSKAWGKHAEIAALLKVWPSVKGLKLVVLRLNREFELKISKPCINCSKILNQLPIEVHYSINNGFV